MNAASVATAPGSGTASGLLTRTSSPSSRDAAVQVGGVGERLGFSIPVAAGREAARDVRDQDDLVDLRLERRQRGLELGGVAVGDDDRRDHPSAFR
jgi:hypothetical protein